MSVTFLHTADWQIGKPFARVADPDKRARLRQARIDVIRTIGKVVRERRASFVLVAGDLFDTVQPENGMISATLNAIGSVPVPVRAIPGNHDPAGPGTVWTREFFISEQRKLAPNFQLLTEPVPVLLEGATILPCPLGGHHDPSDPTAWVCRLAAWQDMAGVGPRIVLGHGSAQDFSDASDDEESSTQLHFIDLEPLPHDELDYIALGDWHGTRQTRFPKAWYSGTPEPDRFPKGPDHDQGNVLCVELPGRGQSARVTPIPTGQMRWRVESFSMGGDESLSRFEQEMDQWIGNRAGQDLLRLELTGHLGFAGDQRLTRLCETAEARLLRFKFRNELQIVPSDDELAKLANRPGDPFIVALANRLCQARSQPGSNESRAIRALRELYVAVEKAGEAP